MNRTIGWITLLGCLALPPAPAGPASPRPPGLTADQWRKDLRTFARELPRRHKNLFHSIPRGQFEQAVLKLEADIPFLAPHEIVVRLKQITAAVGDGHTGVHMPSWFSIYPINMFWFGNELRVTSTLPEYQAALGARVSGIGDVPIAEVESRVRTTFTGAADENEWYVLNTSPAHLNRPEVLHALGIVRGLGPASFQFEDDGGERFALDVRPIATPPVVNGSLAMTGLVSAAARQPLFRQRPGETFWFSEMPDSQTVFVSFRGYGSLAAGTRGLFAALDRKPPQRLVIDMRLNGGGDFNEGRRRLIQPLKARPALTGKGKLFVIVGRRTYSAAMANAIDFRRELGAVLVGEPIGERPNSYSENDEMTLPESRVVVSYSTRFYQFLDQDAPAVEPDVRIDPDWEAFKAGRDTALEWILQSGR